jgi:hypothetical protein
MTGRCTDFMRPIEAHFKLSEGDEETDVKDFFDRWERVWHEGQYDLVPDCAGLHYIRHDEAGNRTVTREAYAAEIAKIREARPDIRVVVYDYSFKGARAWFRFAFKWTDPETGEPRSRQACSPTGSRLDSSWRHGSCCNHWVRHGPTPSLKNTGRASLIINLVAVKPTLTRDGLGSEAKVRRRSVNGNVRIAGPLLNVGDVGELSERLEPGHGDRAAFV